MNSGAIALYGSTKKISTQARTSNTSRPKLLFDLRQEAA
jgi:hypothetical protein